jgi:hypothetical protein
VAPFALLFLRLVWKPLLLRVDVFPICGTRRQRLQVLNFERCITTDSHWI